jgi:hypothetical protein
MSPYLKRVLTMTKGRIDVYLKSKILISWGQANYLLTSIKLPFLKEKIKAIYSADSVFTSEV